MVEQWTENPCVPSSSLGLGTLENSRFRDRRRSKTTYPRSIQDLLGSEFSSPERVGDGGSSNGRTTVFGTVNRGSNPCPPASFGAGHPRLELIAAAKRHCSSATKYGAYSSKAERLIVDQKVAGSSPARRPWCPVESWILVREETQPDALFKVRGG